jgi:GH25 family lysozyme M1 (1,4-beta-N-acetylmuramidase)
LIERVPIVAGTPVITSSATPTAERSRRPPLVIAAVATFLVVIAVWAALFLRIPRKANDDEIRSPNGGAIGATATVSPSVPRPLLLPSAYTPVPRQDVPLSALAKGVDVSHHNGSIFWQALKDAGYSFAVIKATQGSSLIDRNFETNFASARTAGFICGAYHFYDMGVDPDAQADNFLRNASFEPGNLPPVLDLEYASDGQQPTSNAGLVFDMGRFLGRLSAATGRKPIIYADRRFATAHYSELTSLSGYPLWLADYGTAPRVPSVWNTWTLWQANPTAVIPGISGRVNLSYFNGSVTDLRAFAGLSKP